VSELLWSRGVNERGQRGVRGCCLFVLRGHVHGAPRARLRVLWTGAPGLGEMGGARARPKRHRGCGSTRTPTGGSLPTESKERGVASFVGSREKELRGRERELC